MHFKLYFGLFFQVPRCICWKRKNESDEKEHVSCVDRQTDRMWCCWLSFSLSLFLSFSTFQRSHSINVTSSSWALRTGGGKQKTDRQASLQLASELASSLFLQRHVSHSWLRRGAAMLSLRYTRHRERERREDEKSNCPKNWVWIGGGKKKEALSVSELRKQSSHARTRRRDVVIAAAAALLIVVRRGRIGEAQLDSVRTYVCSTTYIRT